MSRNDDDDDDEDEDHRQRNGCDATTQERFQPSFGLRSSVSNVFPGLT